MGLDLELVDTEKNINLSELYAIMDVIRDMFDWYLDKNDRQHDYTVKANLIKSITKNDILDKFKSIDFSYNHEAETNFRFLENIPENRFNDHILTIANAIEEFDEQNSCIEFDYDKLPQDCIAWTTSWNIRILLLNECQADWHKFHNDCVIELDGNKIKRMIKKWKRMGWKITLAKWIRYFKPDASERMVEDICQELNVTDPYVVLSDLIFFRTTFLEILKRHNPKKRIWLISSY